MITNLFSIFDPSSSLINFNWIASLFIITFLPVLYWLIPSRINSIWMLFSFTLLKELKSILPHNYTKNIFFFLLIIIFILLNNFVSLFPYIFTTSAHLRISLSLALPLWISFILHGWIYKTNNIFNHLVPQGTPPILIPFIVLIERVRNIIRPLTLAVRLRANIIAGHLLLTLLSSTGSKINYLVIIILIFIQCALLILEISVSLIQSYVFTILSTLYCNESK